MDHKIERTNNTFMRDHTNTHAKISPTVISIVTLYAAQSFTHIVG